MGSSARTHENTEGFTLIEILIMMVILSFVALGIAGLFSHAMITNASGHDGSVQTLQPINRNFLIEYTVEDFRVDNWTQAVSGSGGWSVPTTGTGSVTDNANMKRITMTVTSTNQVLRGRRVLTVTSLKIPG